MKIKFSNLLFIIETLIFLVPSGYDKKSIIFILFDILKFIIKNFNELNHFFLRHQSKPVLKSS